MESKQLSKRMLSQDIAKGLCIISVMLSHTIALPSLANKIVYSIFGFALSYFFIISGYNYHGKNCSYGKIVWKRFKQLFIPFFYVLLGSIIIFGSIGILAFSVSLKDVGINALQSFCGEFNLSNFGLSVTKNVFFIPSWFIWYMFTGYVVFYAIADWALNNTKRTIFTIVGLVGISFIICLLSSLILKENAFIIFGIPFVAPIICSPFIAAQILLGALLGKYKVFSIGKERKWFLIISCLIAAAITITFGFFFPMVAGVAGGFLFGIIPCAVNFGIWEALLAFVLGFLFTYYFLQFCRLIEKVPVLSSALTFVGQHSLELYLIHFSISLLFKNLFKCDTTAVLPITPQSSNVYVLLITLTISIGAVYLFTLIKNKIKNSKINKSTEC